MVIGTSQCDEEWCAERVSSYLALLDGARGEHDGRARVARLAAVVRTASQHANMQKRSKPVCCTRYAHHHRLTLANTRHHESVREGLQVRGLRGVIERETTM